MTDNIDDVVAAAESIGPNEVVLIELSHGSILADLDDVPKAVPFSIYVLLPTLIVAALSCSLSKICHDACRPLIACCSQRLAFHRHPRFVQMGSYRESDAEREKTTTFNGSGTHLVMQACECEGVFSGKIMPSAGLGA
ncbi:hypothetical protein [Terriglobus sp.]|uniref:hypothetical protein n=1 Tax=Terriglobus sp. TaxID=1889013 RepID=UPI003B002541